MSPLCSYCMRELVRGVSQKHELNSPHLMSSSIHSPTQLQSSRATIPFTGSFTLILHTQDKVVSTSRESAPACCIFTVPGGGPQLRLLRLAPCASPPPCGECPPCSSRSTCRSSRIAGGGSWWTSASLAAQRRKVKGEQILVFGLGETGDRIK